MASSGIKNRERKREKVVAKYQARREALQARIHDSQLNDEERMQARLEFQRLPRNSSRVRLRRRCAITGRPRGVFRKFNLCRNILREMAMRGEVPGMTKASW